MLPAFLIIALFVSCSTSDAQSIARSENRGLYDSIPEVDRESLRLGIDKVLTSQTSGKWDEMYGLLDNEKHLTKEKFAREMLGMHRLIGFSMDSITYVPPADVWSVDGCAAFDPPLRGRPVGVFSAFTARRTNDGWRFTPVAVVLLKDEPGRTRPCHLKDK